MGPSRRDPGDLRRAAARVGDVGTTLVRRHRTFRRPGARAAHRLGPTGRHPEAGFGWAVGVDRTDRSPVHVGVCAHPGRGHRRLGDGGPSRPARPVDHRRPLRPRRDAGRGGGLGRRPRSSRPRRRSGRCRQDPHAHRRRQRPRRPSPPGLRCGTHGEGRPHPPTRHRDLLRHRRQTAPRMATHRPATTTRVPARPRSDPHRRRGRDALYTRFPPRRFLGHGERVAAGPDRRSAPAAGRRSGRPAGRAVRQRPGRPTRTSTPLQASVGGGRVAAAAIR